MELDRLIAVDYPGSVPCWLDQGVVLADGDIIRGVVSGLGADGLAFASDMGGAMVIPLADLAAVVLAPVRLATAAPDGSAVPGALLSNGDRLSGSPQSIADGRLGLDTGRRIVQLPLDRVRMVILRAPTPPTGAYQAVRLANGDRRSGTLTALSDASFSLRMASGTLTLPTRMLRSLWSEGGALTPLESLPIARLAVVPQFDEQPSASMDRLRDGWIMAGGRRIEHGLVLDAGCIASVALDGRCSRFIAELALASSEGTAEAKVLVDGKVAFESGPMGAADGPRPVCVSLAGAHTLDLAVTPSLACDSAHAPVSWAWPTVVR